MTISSANSPAINGRGPVTKTVDKMFSDKAPEGSFTDTLQDVYYSKPADSKLLSEVTEAKQEKYKELLDQAVSQGLMTEAQAAAREEQFVTGSMGPYNKKEVTPPGAKVLDILRDMDNEQFCLIRHPQQCGDGLYRPMDFYISPGHLTLKAAARGWETSKDPDGTDVPVADVVVVGAGPGGLTTTWQLARRGGRVVCFESELAGSNFNDGGAKPVHHMRTSSNYTNLINEGHSAASLEHPISLSGTLPISRPHAKAGRDGQHKLTGEEMHGVYPDIVNSLDPNVPATRGELWNHLSDIAYSVANDFPDAVLCERSPVEDVRYGADGLFEVTSTRGHKIKCKEIVISSGLTGPKGERARSIDVLEKLGKAHPDKTITLQKIGDAQTNAHDLSEMARGEDTETLIVNDRLLGDQSFRQTFAAIPAGAHAAMIGSGESGIKGALEMAHLNPNITIDFFVKGYLESAQVQVPAENFDQAVIEATLGDEHRAHMLKEMYKFFDTPVTPRSLQEMFELQAAGRVRIFELGAHFDDKSMTLTSNEDGTTKAELKLESCKENLAKMEAHYKKVGLLPQDSSLTPADNYHAFIQAPGYNKVPLEKNPLLNKLPAEVQDRVHANSITSSLHPGQSGLPGLGTAGRLLAEELAERLVPDDRRADIGYPTDHGVDYRGWSDHDVNAIITSLGGDPKVSDEIKAEIAKNGSSPREYLLYLTGQDSKLRNTAAKPESERTPAEQELLERATHLGKRLYNEVPKLYAEVLEKDESPQK